MVSRRALVVGLASSIVATACASQQIGTPQTAAAPPAATPAPTPAPAPAALGATPAAPSSTAAPTPQPTPPARLSATPPAPTPAPTLTPPTEPAPAPIALDLRLWNGTAEVQLDGRTVEPGHLLVDTGPHQAAALVDGEVVAIADIPLDGGVVDLVVPPPLTALAIMIENQADARPQTGLTAADVVYEALAEGGITRFIAVYLSADAPVVGPVRSLRHYFAFMAADYAADVVHIGASPEGFAWRDALHMGYLDESAGDPGVWRIRTRPPPHNAYTDTAADRGFLLNRNSGRQKGYGWGPLRFKPDAPRGQESAENIGLSFGQWVYHVGYTWDSGQERYLRFMEGGAHRDGGSGEQIAPATVVVQFTDVEPIPGDEKLRLDVDLIGGSGQLVVFSGGTRREGSWSKSAPNATTQWLDDQGDPLVIPPGPVWVEVLPLGSPLTSA